jgi:L-rhamnose mutarotase
MNNIHLLPTHKPSRLYEFGGSYSLQPKAQENFRNYHIYITSDEEIKEGNWVFNSHKVEFAPQVYEMPSHPIEEKWWDEEELSTTKKIILTTDQSLDGVQAIDDEFLEWFVKNPSCEEVEIVDDWNSPRIDAYEYKIIIPQEEPKQETLEEAAENYGEIYRCPATNDNEYCRHDIISAINFGAKWQAERMYKNMEELILLLKHTTEYEVLENFRNKVSKFETLCGSK